MSTYTQIIYHIVFSTKNREKTLDLNHREIILKYIWGIVKNQNCHLYQVNMMEDHIHILSSLHPGISLANFVKTIKLSTGNFMKQEKISPYFSHWQSGYGAFTVDWTEKEHVISYIKNQQENHKKFDFLGEFKKLLDDFGIKYNENYLL